MATMPPSRPADADFFSSLLEMEPDIAQISIAVAKLRITGMRISSIDSFEDCAGPEVGH